MPDFTIQSCMSVTQYIYQMLLMGNNGCQWLAKGYKVMLDTRDLYQINLKTYVIYSHYFFTITLYVYVG